MKKVWFGVGAALAVLLALPVSAAEGQATAEEADPGKEFIQICFAPNVPNDSATVPTAGVKVGAPISTGAPVYGVEASVLWAGSDEVYGFQTCIITATCQKMEGLQFSIVNFADECNGLQLGVVNFAKTKTFQVGILNFVEDGWLPFCLVCNFQF